jgi:hypothetical protein
MMTMAALCVLCLVGAIGTIVSIVMLFQLAHDVFRGIALISLKTFGLAAISLVLLLWLSGNMWARYAVVAVISTIGLAGAATQSQRISPLVKSFVRQLSFGAIILVVLGYVLWVFIQNLIDPYKYFWLLFFASAIICLVLVATLLSWYYLYFQEVVALLRGQSEAKTNEIIF